MDDPDVMGFLLFWGLIILAIFKPWWALGVFIGILLWMGIRLAAITIHDRHTVKTHNKRRVREMVEKIEAERKLGGH